MASFKTHCSLTVHCIILPDITGKDNVDHLPILISENGINKRLGVPKRITGTGEAMANTIMVTLFDWGVTDRIQSL